MCQLVPPSKQWACAHDRIRSLFFLCVKEMLVARLNHSRGQSSQTPKHFHLKLKERMNGSVWPACTEFEMLERLWKIQTSKINTSAITTIKIKMWAGPGAEPLPMLTSAVIYAPWQNTVGRLLRENKGVNIIFWRCLQACHPPAELCSEVPAPLMTDGRQDAAESGQTGGQLGTGHTMVWGNERSPPFDPAFALTQQVIHKHADRDWVSPTSSELSGGLGEKGDVSKSL